MKLSDKGFLDTFSTLRSFGSREYTKEVITVDSVFLNMVEMFRKKIKYNLYYDTLRGEVCRTGFLATLF